MPNMEQDFRAWVLTQKKTAGKNKGENFTEIDAKKFADALNEYMPNLIGRSDTLFNETNVDVIEGLLQRFSKDGDLYTRDKKGAWTGLGKDSLLKYKKFLESRNTQNDSSDTNMEQEFREWLGKERRKGKTKDFFDTAHQNKFSEALREVIPSWIGRSDSLFCETDVEFIKELYDRCVKDGDLSEKNKNYKHYCASGALAQYIKFLESRNTQNDFSNTTKEGKTMKKLLNQILYGPPGTGKTYSTVKVALEILGATDEQKNEIKSIKQLKKVFGSQIEFITFHQSFSYEDFVEGIKAKANTDGSLTYKTKNGIFKRICKAATNAEFTSEEVYSSESQEEADEDENNDSIKQLYEIIDMLKELLLEKPLELKLKKGGRNFTLRYNDKSGKGDTFYAHSSIGEKTGNPVSVRNLVTIYKNPAAKSNTVNDRRSYLIPTIEYLENELGLQKYQATEKPKEQENDSLKQFRKAIEKLKQWLLKEPLKLKTFYLSYSASKGKDHFFSLASTKDKPTKMYIRDIINLYKNPDIPSNNPIKQPGGIHYKAYKKTIVEYIKTKFGVPDYQENNSDTQPHQEIEESEALENEFDSQEIQVIKKPHVLIIDEINRGNISRILGELITLIEPSKRAGEDEEIKVTLPYSKKRFSVPNNLYIIGTMNTADRSLAQIDIALRRRFRFVEMMPEYKPNLFSDDITDVNLPKMLEVMNTRICRLLDREHQIGHSFFMKEKVASLEDLKETFQHEILPLLEEYFFENWENILEVLNDKNATIFYTKIPGNENSNTPYRKLKANEWDELDEEAFKNICKGINDSE